MGGALLLLVLGLSLTIAVPVIAALIRERQRIQDRMSNSTLPINLAENEDGVIVAEGRGHLVFINAQARQWFGMNGGEPSLEALADAIPRIEQEQFMELFGREGQASFQVGSRRIDAASHFVPHKDSTQLVVVLRELPTLQSSTPTANGNGRKAPLPIHAGRDPQQVVALMNKITDALNAEMKLGETLNALLESLYAVVAFDLGEVTLWEPDLQILRPAGCAGAKAAEYIAQFEKTDGVYHLDDSFSGWLARYRQPLLIANVSARPDVRAKIANSQFVSFVGIPLLRGDKLVGTLELASAKRGGFNHEDLALLQAIGGQIGIAIENSRLSQTQAERVSQLSGLQQIAQAMGSFAVPREMYGQLTSRIGGLMNSDIVGVLVLDAEQAILEPQLPFLNVPDSIATLFRLPVGEDSPLWRLWKRRASWYTNEASADPSVREFGLIALVEPLGIQRLSLTPMLSGERAVGLLLVANKRDGSGFTEDDMRLMAVFASQTAILVENARLYQREQERSGAGSGLEQITRVLDVLEHPATLYAQITDRAARQMRVQYAGILLLDGAGVKLAAQEPLYGLERAIVPYYEVAAQTREARARLETAWFINALDNDVRTREMGIDALARLVDLRQVAFAPLYAGGEFIGALHIANRLNGGAFTENDMKALSGLAAQASDLIADSITFRETQRRAQEADGLRQIAEVAAMSLPLDEALGRIVESTRVLLGGQVASLALLDETTGQLVVRPDLMRGIESFTEPFLIDIYDSAMQTSVAVSRRAFLSNDVLNDGRVLPIYRAFAERYGLFNTIQVPIIAREKSIGEFSVANRKGDFTANDLKLVRAIAVQIADTLDRARLFATTDADLRTRIEELDSLTRVSNELNQTVQLERVLEVIRVEAARTTQAREATVLLLKERGEWEIDTQLLVQERIGVSVPTDGTLHSVERKVILEGRALRVNDYAQDPRETLIGTRRSAVVVPIRYNDQVRGTIHVLSDTPSAFTERTITFMQALANQASLALSNAMRYQQQIERNDQLTQRADQISQIFEVSNLLRTETRLETILDAVAVSVVETVGFRIALISVVDTERDILRRVAQSGIPLTQFEEINKVTPPLAMVESLFQERYRMSASYFLLGEQEAQWMSPTLERTLNSSGFTGEGPNAWRENDLLLIPFRNVAGQLIGLMSVDQPRDGKRPTRAVIETLEIFAAQASFAVENFGILQAFRREAQETRRERDRLAQLAAVTSDIQRAPDLESRVQIIADGIRAQGWGRVLITLRTPDMEPQETISSGYTENDRARLRSVLLPGIVWQQRLSDPEFRKYRVGQGYYIRHSDPWMTENKLLAGETLAPERPANAVPEGWDPLDCVYLPIYGLDQSRVVGIISMDMPTDGMPPTEASLRPIELFAAQAAATIDNTRLIEERTRAAEQEARLNAVMEAVSSTLDPSEIMAAVARGLREIVPFSSMNVALQNWSEDMLETLHIRQSRYDASDFATDPTPSIPIEGTALGRAYREQAARYYRLADGDPNARLSDMSAWQAEGEQSALVVPLIAGGRAVGALHLGSRSADEAEFRRLLPLVGRMANLTGVAIENARLFQEAIDRERFSASLNRIGQSINVLLDLRSILDTLCSEIVNILDTAGAYVWLVRDMELVAAAGRGVGVEQVLDAKIGFDTPGSLVTAAYHEKAPLVVNDYPDQTRFVALLQDTLVEAALVVPLMRDERVIGVLVLIHTDPNRAFIPPDVERTNAYAVQAAIAIERATLEMSLQARASELTALSEASGELTATLNADELVNRVVEQFSRILRYDTVTLWLREGDVLIIRAVRGYENGEELIGVRAEIADSELFEQIAARGQVLTIGDVTGDPRFPPHPERPMRSWMGVALNYKDALTGLLVVEKEEARFYAAPQEQLALAFANQAAVAIENARLFQQQDAAARENTQLYQDARRRAAELNAQAQRLALVNRVSTALAYSLDLENVFEVALRELAGVLGLDRGSAVIIEQPDKKRGRVVMEFPRGDAPADYYIPLEDNQIYDLIRRTLQPVSITNIHTDPRAERVRELLTRFGVYSTITVPLVVSGQLIGFISIDSTQDYREFNADDIEIAQIIAGQAAIAVQNADLFSQASVRTRELETLFEATQVTSSSLNLQEVTRSAANQMLPALEADACTVLLIDEVDHWLDVRADVHNAPNPQGVQRAGLHLPLTEFPTRDRALHSQQVIALYTSEDEIDVAERRLFLMRGTQGRLLIPLVVREQAIGMIVVEIMDPQRRFTAAEVRLGRALANQASIALENARLQTETTEKLQELSVINDMAKALAASIEPAEIYGALSSHLPMLTHAEMLLLAVYDPDADQISYPVALRDNKPIAAPPHALRDDEISYVIKRRMPLLLVGEDIEEVVRIFGVKRSILNARSFLGVPLITGDAVVGVLAVADQNSTRAFGLDDQRVLTTIASQVAVSLQNARLFERNRRFTNELESRVTSRTEELRSERDRLNFLYRITASLTASLDMEQVLSRALEMIANAVGAELGAILGIDSISDNLMYRAVYDAKGQAAEPAISLSQREGLVGWVIQTQQSLLLPDVQEDGRWLRNGPMDDEPRSAIVALLEANEDILGVITLYNRKPNAFNDDHLRLVTAAAGQIATAMNNADLYGLIREQAERLGAMVRREQVDATKNASIVESIADGLMVADPSGEIIQFNNAAEQILGLPKKQVMGRFIGDVAGLYSTGGAQRWLNALQTWMDDPTAHKPGDSLQEQIELPDGKIVSVLLSPVNMGDQFLGTVSIFRDITREREVDRLKSEFVATVSHELRTPMTSIKGYADLLLLGAGGALTDQQKNFLNTIRTNANRLSVLVNELLEISRVDRGMVKMNMQPTNLGEVIETSLSHLRGRISAEDKDLKVSSFINKGLPLVSADFDKMVQVFNNLLDNAFSYTYAGGEISVEAKADGADHIIVSVHDSGIGISKEVQPRVFERFFRGEENPLVMETSGTGLGLSIVQEYIAIHNGKIWLESEPGQGTTFYVRLPALA